MTKLQAGRYLNSVADTVDKGAPLFPIDVAHIRAIATALTEEARMWSKPSDEST